MDKKQKYSDKDGKILSTQLVTYNNLHVISKRGKEILLLRKTKDYNKFNGNNIMFIETMAK